MAEDSYYDQDSADFAVNFIQALTHTEGRWAGNLFELIGKNVLSEIYLEFLNQMGIVSLIPIMSKYPKNKENQS